MLLRLCLVSILVASCTTAPGPTTIAPASTAPGEATILPSSTIPPPTTSTPAALPPCQAGIQPYVEAGGAGVFERRDSDAEIVTSVRWVRYEGCDRVVIDLATPEGAPAVSPPGVGPLFIRSAGVLRLQLDSAVTGSAIRDQVVDGGLVDHAYVVRRPNGDLFVDLHLFRPAAIRVSVASQPARIIVDAVLGGSEYPSPAIVTGDMVVVDPVGGSVLYPFTVNGYALTSDDTLTVTLSSETEETAAAAEVGRGADAWGAFTVLIPDGPVGLVSMQVGDAIELPLDMG